VDNKSKMRHKRNFIAKVAIKIGGLGEFIATIVAIKRPVLNGVKG